MKLHKFVDREDFKNEHMIRIPKKVKFILTLTFCISLVGCYYDNEEELYPSNTCTTSDLSYSANVIPLLENNGCIGCHQSTNQSGGIRLDTYAEVKINVDNGRLMGSIRHESGFKAMPLGTTNQINGCSIDQIQAWINDGALDN